MLAGHLKGPGIQIPNQAVAAVGYHLLVLSSHILHHVEKTPH